MSLPPANDKDNAQKAALVEQSAAGIKSKQNHLGPAWFDADILANVPPYNNSSIDMPNNAFLIGQYLPRNEDLDRRLTQWFALPSATGGDDDKNSAWGVKTQPTDLLLDYAEMKNKEAQYRAELDLAAQLIDPKDPSSQRAAFAMYPELRDIPEERSMKIAKFHVMLEAILRAGTCNSREEVQMIFVLLDPRTIIPMKPGWTELFGLDSGGTVTNAALTAEFKNTLYWMFDPYAYQSIQIVPSKGGTGVTLDGQFLALGAGVSIEQGKIKVAIARRLFPALREADHNKVIEFIFMLANRRAAGSGDNIGTPNSGSGSAMLSGNELLPIIGSAGGARTLASKVLKEKFTAEMFK